MDGQIGVLNVGAGDTKLSFDPNNPIETERTSRIVKDMLKRGYALLIEIGKDEKGEPKYARAKDFDENHYEYIIADFDSAVAAEEDKKRDDAVEQRTAPKKRGKKSGAAASTRRVKATETNAIAVSRISGG